MTVDQPAHRLRLLVVDDHEVVRQGLVALLDRRSGSRSAQAGSVGESIALAARHEPDLVIMDVRLPDGSGVEACREIRAPVPRRGSSCSRASRTRRRCSRRSSPAPAATCSSRSADATWSAPSSPSEGGVAAGPGGH